MMTLPLSHNETAAGADHRNPCIDGDDDGDDDHLLSLKVERWHSDMRLVWLTMSYSLYSLDWLCCCHAPLHLMSQQQPPLRPDYFGVLIEKGDCLYYPVDSTELYLY